MDRESQDLPQLTPEDLADPHAPVTINGITAPLWQVAHLLGLDHSNLSPGSSPRASSTGVHRLYPTGREGRPTSPNNLWGDTVVPVFQGLPRPDSQTLPLVKDKNCGRGTSRTRESNRAVSVANPFGTTSNTGQIALCPPSKALPAPPGQRAVSISSPPPIQSCMPPVPTVRGASFSSRLAELRRSPKSHDSVGRPATLLEAARPMTPTAPRQIVRSTVPSQNAPTHLSSQSGLADEARGPRAASSTSACSAHGLIACGYCRKPGNVGWTERWLDLELASQHRPLSPQGQEGSGRGKPLPAFTETALDFTIRRPASPAGQEEAGSEQRWSHDTHGTLAELSVNKIRKVKRVFSFARGTPLSDPILERKLLTAAQEDDAGLKSRWSSDSSPETVAKKVKKIKSAFTSGRGQLPVSRPATRAGQADADLQSRWSPDSASGTAVKKAKKIKSVFNFVKGNRLASEGRPEASLAQAGLGPKSRSSPDSDPQTAAKAVTRMKSMFSFAKGNVAASGRKTAAAVREDDDDDDDDAGLKSRLSPDSSSETASKAVRKMKSIFNLARPRARRPEADKP
ncbi:hypothetical protein VTK56DRAFT_9016 [Thermocarpiscus australiensis]